MPTNGPCSATATVPDDKILVPGVISTTTNYVEHPELVAERIVRFADLVGRERVIAGTDCGFGTFAGFGPVDPDIVYLKLRILVEGAAIASGRLWGGLSAAADADAGSARVLPVAGARLHYSVTGSGPAVALVHGWALDADMWAPQRVALGQRHTVIAYDRRGFGRSTGTPGIAHDVQDLRARSTHCRSSASPSSVCRRAPAWRCVLPQACPSAYAHWCWTARRARTTSRKQNRTPTCPSPTIATCSLATA